MFVKAKQNPWSTLKIMFGIRSFYKGLVFLLLTLASTAYALEFPLPAQGAMIGEVKHIKSQPGDTLSIIGHRYDIGYVEMAESNPHLDPDRTLSAGTEVQVPMHFILPEAPRRGIVINLAELRLYYFPPSKNTVVTLPVGIGREGWETPVGGTKISAKTKNPTWYPTAAVRADAAAQGYFLPTAVPPGPDNPLGKYSMRLGGTSYLIHSTNKPEGVGRRSSAGCMRMFAEDAEYLFRSVNVGTPVYIVNQPYKVTWQGNDLVLEAHMPLQEQQLNDGSDLAPMVQEVLKVARLRPYRINWEAVKAVADEQSGVPTVIGHSTVKKLQNFVENSEQTSDETRWTAVNTAVTGQVSGTEHAQEAAVRSQEAMNSSDTTLQSADASAQSAELGSFASDPMPARN